VLFAPGYEFSCISLPSDVDTYIWPFTLTVLRSQPPHTQPPHRRPGRHVIKKKLRPEISRLGYRYPSDSFAHKMVPQDFAILRVSQTTHLIPVFFLQSLTLVPFQRKLPWVSKMAKSDPTPGRTGTNGVHPGHRRVRWAPGAQGRASDPPGPRAHTCTDSPGP